MHKMHKKLSVILASTRDLGIGRNNDLPWPKLKQDMKLFKNLTTNNSVIMGMNTFNSLGKKPLPNRLNVVLTSKAKRDYQEYESGSTKFFGGLQEAIEYLDTDEKIEENFIIGGAKIYDQVFKDHDAYPVSSLYWTRVAKDFTVDTSIDKDAFTALTKKLGKPVVSSTFVEHGDINYDFVAYGPYNKKIWNLKKSEEYQYLDLLKDIIANGETREDRTGTGTIGSFGRMMRFNLENSFPLLTTKNVFFKGVLEELLWFVNGNTNAKDLSDKGVKIWDGNGSRAFLDSRGLNDNPEGDLGPVYGFQWRHFGAEYNGTTADYAGKGVDQLQGVIDALKKDKFSRRMLVSAWNPVDLHKMALPPCHVLFQFYVDQGDRLSCSLYQRSCDVGLGVPFNIASYSLLVCLLADMLNMRRGDFVYFMGDVHVYSNHVEALKKQMSRIPQTFPVLHINRDVKAENIEDYKGEDVVLKGYHPLKKIKMDMAV